MALGKRSEWICWHAGSSGGASTTSFGSRDARLSAVGADRSRPRCRESSKLQDASANRAKARRKPCTHARRRTLDLHACKRATESSSLVTATWKSMVSAKWQPSDEVLRVARRLAEAAMVATDRRNRLVVMLQLAEDLRRVVAGNLPSEQAATTRALLAEELGRLRPGTVWQQVAALRMVARLTLGECAELLGRPREQLALVWRATQLRIFQSVRQRLKSSGERETR